MSITPSPDIPRLPRWLRPLRGGHDNLGPVGAAVELIVARAAERRAHEALDQTARCLDAATDERDTADVELAQLREVHGEVERERDQLERDLAAARSDRAAISEELRQTRHDLAQAYQALIKARSIRTLCGALLHRYQPKPERGPELNVAVASDSQLGEWRLQLDQLVQLVIPEEPQ